MRSNRLEDAFKEALDYRSRLFLEDWKIAQYDAFTRIEDLKRLIEEFDNPEIYRHAIVSAIAALQSFHRAAIVNITNQGDPYSARAAERFSEKFTLKDAMSAVSGNIVSFGELAAHLAPCSSIADIISWLDAVLGIPTKEMMKNSVDPYDIRNNVENPNKLVSDINTLFSNVETAFKTRHIYAHEAAVHFIISKEECKNIVNSVDLFMRAIDAVLWLTAFKNHPLTQTEMNISATEDARKARTELALVLKKTKRIARKKGTLKWLRNNQRAWKQTERDWYLNTYYAQQGTIWPSLAGADWADSYRARARQLKAWNAAGSPSDDDMEAWLSDLPA